MSKPIIGIPPHWYADEKFYLLRPGYIDGIIEAGGLPVILPLTMDETLLEQACEMVDGILLSGGTDVYPGLYGETRHKACDTPCNVRDSTETFIFKKAVLEMNKPLLGICRGFQMLNVVLGGSLYQDLPSQYEETGKKVYHSQAFELMAHSVNIMEGSELHTLLGKDIIYVNSCHHQGIKVLAEQLTCTGVSEDGLVEAFCMPGRKFVWGVQWHPEAILHDESSRKLFKVFVENCIGG